MIQKLKKIGFSLILLLVALSNSIAQSIYNSTNYATVGDAFYLTTANNLTIDYSTTGTNYNWNFATLTGISQNELQFKNPNTTGYSILTFPYIYNSNNTNLASTNGTTTLLNVAGKTIGTQDLYDYYKKTNTELTQVTSAYKLNYNGTLIPVKNQYTIPDKIYTFPIKFGNTETNNSEYTVNIPGVYYQSKTVERTNLVDGWGSVSTPFGNFPNVLRMSTTIIENDSISIGDEGLPRVIRTSRELKWFDTSKKYPVLIVSQSFVANTWTTTKIEYLDAKKDFQTTALFAFTPALPTAGATVYFQNLSANATTYNWDFGDPSSGSSNSSTDQNPTHIFSTNGTYNVKLTSSNDSFAKSITLPVIVSDDTVALFAYTPALPIAGENVTFQNLSVNGTSYIWDFGDSSSGSANSSTEKNPTHIFSTKGAYNVKLTSSNASSTNSITLPVFVNDAPVALFVYLPSLPIAGENVNFQNLSANATTYVWNFGDPSSGSFNSSSEKNPTHIFSITGTYQVMLTSSNGTFTKSITLPVVVSNVLGINTSLKNEKVLIYPNPFSNYISISGEKNLSDYELINLEGKVFYKGNAIQSKDLSFLSKGIYLLKVTENNKTETYKLVKN